MRTDVHMACTSTPPASKDIQGLGSIERRPKAMEQCLNGRIESRPKGRALLLPRSLRSPCLPALNERTNERPSSDGRSFDVTLLVSVPVEANARGIGAARRPFARIPERHSTVRAYAREDRAMHSRDERSGRTLCDLLGDNAPCVIRYACCFVTFDSDSEHDTFPFEGRGVTHTFASLPHVVLRARRDRVVRRDDRRNGLRGERIEHVLRDITREYPRRILRVARANVLRAQIRTHALPSLMSVRCAEDQRCKLIRRERFASGKLDRDGRVVRVRLVLLGHLTSLRPVRVACHPPIIANERTHMYPIFVRR